MKFKIRLTFLLLAFVLVFSLTLLLSDDMVVKAIAETTNSHLDAKMYFTGDNSIWHIGLSIAFGVYVVFLSIYSLALGKVKFDSLSLLITVLFGIVTVVFGVMGIFNNCIACLIIMNINIALLYVAVAILISGKSVLTKE